MRRINTILAFFVLALVLIATRLFYWQFINRDQLLTQAFGQYYQRFEIPAERGLIYSADGFPLVTNQQAFLLYASLPDLKEDPVEIAQKIAPIIINAKFVNQPDSEPEKIKEEIKQQTAEINQKLQTKNVSWVQLARKIPLSTKEQIESLKILGLGFQSDFTRFYPEASMAAHLLGFVGFDKAGRDTGYFGLEGFYNSQLKGKAGVLRQERDAAGRPIINLTYQPIEPENGRGLQTTIDRTVQFIVEKQLAQAVAKYQAKAGSVIVLEPNNGKILAMASYPNYDPNLWQEYSEDTFKNPLVADAYEPGSTFKIVAMSAAINEKVVKPETICDRCDGPREIGGFTIRTWNNKYYLNSTVVEILEHSDNVGMVFVAEKLGVDRLLKYIKNFGFGTRTKIDLQEEASPTLRERSEWKAIDAATVSFGQGIAVTAAQMAQATVVIANGGNLVQPYLVEKIIGKSKQFENKPKVVKRVIKPETAKILTEMMVAAVDNGEARAFKPKGFRIAGKTGTAQIPVEGHYDPEKTIASFVGFAPADNPKFVMLVRFLEPKTSRFGSETAAPTFFAIAKELFVYFGITPER